MKARHDPIFELDQNYMGSYHMVTELTLNVIEEEEEEEEDQLASLLQRKVSWDCIRRIVQREACMVYSTAPAFRRPKA